MPLYGVMPFFSPTNTLDLGSASFKPRDVYAGTQFLAADGTAAAPGYAFSSDTASGLFYDTLVGPILTYGNQRFAGADPNNGTRLLATTLSLGPNLTGSNSDVRLERDAANVLALRNGANAQTLRAYRNFVDTSNYERFAINTGTGITTLAVEAAGTGSENIDLALSPLGTGRVKFLTPLITAVDGALLAVFTANMVGATGGPATATQNGWVALKDSGGNNVWVPCWK